MPGATCVLLIEKAAVRTSTDATFVLTTIVPSNHDPGSIVSVETHIRTMRGGASGAATGGVGKARGGRCDTVRFAGTERGLGEHAATDKPITPAKICKRTT